MMSLEEFRSLYDELKYVPDDPDEILKTWGHGMGLASTLAKAVKALVAADSVIIRQADTIMESTAEVTKCLKEMRCSASKDGFLAKNDVKIELSAVSNVDDSVDDAESENNSDNVVNNENICKNNEKDNNLKPIDVEKSTTTEPHEPINFAMAVKSLKHSEDDVQNTANFGFVNVKARRRRKKSLISSAVIGRKPVSGSGLCTHVFDAFVSRLSPEVTAPELKKYCESTFNESFVVEKLQTKFPSYASFRITGNVRKKSAVLDPNNWESGILIRPFYRFLTK